MSCEVDNTTAPPWFGDLAALARSATATSADFTLAVVTPGVTARRAMLGGQAYRRLKHLLAHFKLSAVHDEQARNVVGSLFHVAAQCGWSRLALKYARKSLAHPSCGGDHNCFCREAGNVVNYLRKAQGETAAERFFSKSVMGRCPFTSSLQMPAPVASFASWLEAKPFWEPTEFALGRLMHASRNALLLELRPFWQRATADVALWRTHEAGGPVGQDAVLVEDGYWRQLSLFNTGGVWNETVCGELPLTCGLLSRFNATDEGRHELGGKAKLFELGGRSSLRPHFGPTNTRLLLHFLISGAADSTLRVGQVTHRWRAEGELVVFDDSIEHAVRNDALEPRVVLAVQVMHPHLGKGAWDANGKWVYREPSP